MVKNQRNMMGVIIEETIESVRRHHALLESWRILQRLVLGWLAMLIVWVTLARLLGVIDPALGLILWLACFLIVAA